MKDTNGISRPLFGRHRDQRALETWDFGPKKSSGFRKKIKTFPNETVGYHPFLSPKKKNPAQRPELNHCMDFP